MDYNKLKKLVIKPTLNCTANCVFCIYKRKSHIKLRQGKLLTFEDWKKILAEAKDLGVQDFQISGGEPTLYKHLSELVRIGKNYGWNVNLNTNGSLINKGYAKKLLESGLDSVTFSIHGFEPRIHDSIKRTEGSWQKLISAIKIFLRLQKKYPAFKLIAQTVLIKKNFKSFPDLLELCYNLGSDGLTVDYLEGDFKKKYILNEYEIRNFRKRILPKAIKFCKKLNLVNRYKASNAIQKIYSEEIMSISEWNKGIYSSKKNMKNCNIPEQFAMLLPNGHVIPCYMIAYTLKPIVGNLFINSLTEIWYSEKWNKFRKNKSEICKFCPIHHNIWIPFRFDWSKVRFINILKI